MVIPARDVASSTLTRNEVITTRYTKFIEDVTDLFMKSATSIETNVRIWNLRQRKEENATYWGARCKHAMLFRMKKDVADCSRHETFMIEQKLGIKEDVMKEAFGHTKIVTQPYLETTKDFLRRKRLHPPWISMFTDAIVAEADNDSQFIPLSDGGNVTNEDKPAYTEMPFRSYITITPSMECHVRNVPFVAANWT